MLDASGKGNDALAALDQAIRGDPARPELYWQKALILNKRKRTTEALGLLDQAAKALPKEPSIPLIRAATLELSGKTDEALRVLDDVQRTWPEVAGVWVARGIILAAHQKFEEARRALETAAAHGARSPEAWSCLADMTLRSGGTARSDAAEAAVGQALRLAPEDASVQELAGRIAYKNGDFTAAAARELEAIRLQPGLAAAHKDLAQAYTALGRKQEAQAETTAALRPGNQNSPPAQDATIANPERLFETRPPRDW